MKNQYFGEVSDYRKYGLLRAQQSDGNRTLLVAWMLTPDEGGIDDDFREAKERLAHFARERFFLS